MSFDDNWLKNGLPTYQGGKDKSLGKKMIDRLGGPSGFKTDYRTNADGSITKVQLKGDMPPQFDTTSVVPTLPQLPQLITVAPSSDYFTQGFDTVDGVITTAHFDWPGAPYARLTRKVDQIQTYSYRDYHPGSTTWLDTRADRVYDGTLSWSAPYGGRGGANNMQVPLASPIIRDRDGGGNMIPLGYGFNVGDCAPGRSSQLETDNTTDARLGVPLDDPDTPWFQSIYYKWPVGCVFRAAHTPNTTLYENGVPLFSAHILSASAHVSGGVTSYRTIEGVTSATYPNLITEVDPLSLAVCSRTSTGELTFSTGVVFPVPVYWVHQVPFINSSATKAIGIFAVSTTVKVPPRLYEIDMADGSVTDLGPVGAGNALSYSGTIACDYIGDTRVYATKTGACTYLYAGSVETLTLCVNIDLNGAAFSGTAEYISQWGIGGVGNDTRTITASSIPEPIYIDLRFSNYVVMSAEGNSSQVRSATMTNPVGPVYRITGAVRESLSISAVVIVNGKKKPPVLMRGNTVSTDRQIDESVPDNQNYITLGAGEVSCIVYKNEHRLKIATQRSAIHCQAYSAKNQFLVSMVGYGVDGFALAPADMPVHNAYHTPTTTTLINLGTYDGYAKWFYDPYIGKRI